MKAFRITSTDEVQQLLKVYDKEVINVLLLQQGFTEDCIAAIFTGTYKVEYKIAWDLWEALVYTIISKSGACVDPSEEVASLHFATTIATPELDKLALDTIEQFENRL